VLYPQGSDDPPLTIVHRGRVKLVRISPAGHEQMLRVLGPGDVVGETAFLTSSPADHVATTLEETEVCELHRSDARRLLERFPSVSNRLLVELARRLESTERHLSRLTSQDTRQRIVAHLLEVADGRTEFRLPTTKRDLASLVGTTPETLSRQLAALQDRGWIRLGPRGAVKLVDAAALAEL
jgi:CRP/FNR family transcriptional regulator